MSLVKRDEIPLREFNVRRHQFRLQRRIEGKGLSADEFYITDWF